MKKNSNTSQFVNTADVMDALEKTLQMAQRIMRAIRKLVKKTKQQLVTVADYALYCGITIAEAMLALGRVMA